MKTRVKQFGETPPSEAGIGARPGRRTGTHCRADLSILLAQVNGSTCGVCGRARTSTALLAIMASPAPKLVTRKY